jgi:hypothetical protein
MIRSKNQSPQDGGAFSPSARPPADSLTPRFRELFTEHDTISGKLGQVQSELRDLTTNWVAYETAARRKDGRATAESGRTGTATVITTATDALNEKKRRLEDVAAAYTEALPTVLNDLATERDRLQANLSPYLKAESRARVRLHKALDEAYEAARDLTCAIALKEWITDHLPWESEPLLDLTTIWAPADRLLAKGPAAQTPVRVNDVVTALKGL